MDSGPQRRRTQAERRERSREALLEAAAQALARDGYAGLSLERVAKQAGYTRGALYHQFAGKEDLALAVVTWVQETWDDEVGHLLHAEADPAETLLALAREHAAYCRRDVAAVLLNLRVEFNQQDHPVGHTITKLVEGLVTECVRLIEAGRAQGSLPPGPPSQDTAEALLSSMEAIPIQLAGRTPYDVDLTENAVRGVLGLAPRLTTEE